jgi:hypothetical protein
LCKGYVKPHDTFCLGINLVALKRLRVFHTTTLFYLKVSKIGLKCEYTTIRP